MKGTICSWSSKGVDYAKATLQKQNVVCPQLQKLHQTVCLLDHVKGPHTLQRDLLTSLSHCYCGTSITQELKVFQVESSAAMSLMADYGSGSQTVTHGYLGSHRILAKKPLPHTMYRIAALTGSCGQWPKRSRELLVKTV